MKVVVITEHVSEYPDPVFLRKGEQVTLGETDDEYPNWIFATSVSGTQGWVPLQYLEQSACKTSGNMLCDYDSLELNTKSGEILTVQFELNDWYRVTRTNAEVGWVPVMTVQPVPVDAQAPAAADG